MIVALPCPSDCEFYREHNMQSGCSLLDCRTEEIGICPKKVLDPSLIRMNCDYYLAKIADDDHVCLAHMAEARIFNCTRTTLEELTACNDYKQKIPNLVICDGCNVSLPHEHRCHGENAQMGGKPTGKPCNCPACHPAK